MGGGSCSRQGEPARKPQPWSSEGYMRYESVHLWRSHSTAECHKCTDSDLMYPSPTPLSVFENVETAPPPPPDTAHPTTREARSKTGTRDACLCWLPRQNWLEELQHRGQWLKQNEMIASLSKACRLSTTVPGHHTGEPVWPSGKALGW